MTDQPPDIFDLLERFRGQLAASDAAAMRRLVQGYGLLYRRLQGHIDALLMEIESGSITRGGLVRLARYEALIAQTTEELTRYAAYLEGIVNEQAALGIDFGARQSIQLLQAAGPGVGFNRLNNEAIRSLLGFLDPDGPLYGRIRKLAPHTTKLVTDALVEAVGLGYNPRKTASMIRGALGNGLTDALRMTRTVQLYSYREASRANYMLNSDVLEGWIWSAALDARTCMSCIAQHGTFHPVSERLNDHHNGRCAQIPWVKGFDRVLQEGAGRAWFDAQPESVQRQMMGKGKFEAWSGGLFDFERLSTTRDNDVYGPMRVEAPLKELVGGE